MTADGRKIGGVVMEMKNITLKFGGVTAIEDISFDIHEGEIRAIIGPNGARSEERRVGKECRSRWSPYH